MTTVVLRVSRARSWAVAFCSCVNLSGVTLIESNGLSDSSSKGKYLKIVLGLLCSFQ